MSLSSEAATLAEELETTRRLLVKFRDDYVRGGVVDFMRQAHDAVMKAQAVEEDLLRVSAASSLQDAIKEMAGYVTKALSLVYEAEGRAGRSAMLLIEHLELAKRSLSRLTSGLVEAVAFSARATEEVRRHNVAARAALAAAPGPVPGDGVSMATFTMEWNEAVATVRMHAEDARKVFERVRGPVSDFIDRGPCQLLLPLEANLSTLRSTVSEAEARRGAALAAAARAAAARS